MVRKKRFFILAFPILVLAIYHFQKKPNAPIPGGETNLKSVKDNSSRAPSSQIIPSPRGLNSAFGNSTGVKNWLKKDPKIGSFDFSEEVFLSGHLSTEHTKMYYFQQTHRGFKVFNRAIRVILKKDTLELLRVKNSLSEIPPLASEDYLTTEKVKSLIYANLNISKDLLSSNMKSPEVFLQNGKSYLIWRFAQKSHANTEAHQTLYVDAVSGAVLKTESNRFY